MYPAYASPHIDTIAGMPDTFHVSEPVHIRRDDGAPIPGHYEMEVVDADGRRLRRYLTDKGRAEVLRLLDAGRDALSEEQLADLTVEPDLDVLLERMDREAGEGA
jgi:hypothetical protein